MANKITGTLTEGKTSITDIVDLSGGDIGENELLRLAAIAESGSEHPLGQAVVRKARQLRLYQLIIGYLE